jgi:hypothetical protein
MGTKIKNRLTQTLQFDKISLMTLYQTFMSACLQYVARESTKTVDIISKHEKHGDLRMYNENRADLKCVYSVFHIILHNNSHIGVRPH